MPDSARAGSWAKTDLWRGRCWREARPCGVQVAQGSITGGLDIPPAPGSWSALGSCGLSSMLQLLLRGNVYVILFVSAGHASLTEPLTHWVHIVWSDPWWLVGCVRRGVMGWSGVTSFSEAAICMLFSLQEKLLAEYIFKDFLQWMCHMKACHHPVV